jgi:hypothetical protein
MPRPAHITLRDNRLRSLLSLASTHRNALRYDDGCCGARHLPVKADSARCSIEVNSINRRFPNRLASLIADAIYASQLVYDPTRPIPRERFAHSIFFHYTPAQRVRDPDYGWRYDASGRTATDAAQSDFFWQILGQTQQRLQSRLKLYDCDSSVFFTMRTHPATRELGRYDRFVRKVPAITVSLPRNSPNELSSRLSITASSRSLTSMPRTLHMTSSVSATALITSSASHFGVFMSKFSVRLFAFGLAALARLTKQKRRLRANGRGYRNFHDASRH